MADMSGRALSQMAGPGGKPVKPHPKCPYDIEQFDIKTPMGSKKSNVEAYQFKNPEPAKPWKVRTEK
jgi:hypothetical protein